MDPARIERPGLVSTQVPEPGSANEGTAILDLPSLLPLLRAGRVPSALCLTICLLVLGFSSLHANSSLSVSAYYRRSLPALRYAVLPIIFIISCAAHCSDPGWRFPALSTAFTTLACDEHIHYIAACVPDSAYSLPGILPDFTGVSLWTYQHIS